MGLYYIRAEECILGIAIVCVCACVCARSCACSVCLCVQCVLRSACVQQCVRALVCDHAAILSPSHSFVGCRVGQGVGCRCGVGQGAGCRV